MKALSSVRLPTQAERIAALEQKAEIWDDMKNKVDDIHALLVGAKAILWLATKISGGIGVVGVLITIWKFFH